VESRAMVAAAASAHRILLERAQRWRGLARVEDGDLPTRRVDVATGPRGDSRKALHEVERGTFRREHQCRGSADLGGDGARLALITVAILEGDVDGGIELAEHFRRDVEPGENTGRLHYECPVAAYLCRYRRFGRDIAPPEIFGE